MNTVSDKKSLLKKTLEVGSNTFLSRMLGLTREILLMRYLGVDVLADAFTTAFMLPNSLRKIFAEGALTAAFVPTLITIYKKEGKDQASSLTTLVFLVFESILLVCCFFIMWKAQLIIHLFAPGYSPEKVAATVPLLRILMPFIFFISSSALLTGALQSVNHFFIPSFGPVLLNVSYILGILMCLYGAYPPTYLCWAIIGGGALQCIMHIITYYRLGFSFTAWNATTITYFMKIIIKFLLCFLSMSVMEANFVIDQHFASYLPTGSVTLIKYATSFMGIPLGVFAVAFSTILLPHFTRLKLEQPEKLHLYLTESIKLIIWVTIPITLIMMFFSQDIFLTLLASTSSKFSIHRVPEAGTILVGFMVGLCFFSLNKIIFSMYYSFHDTFYPIIIAIIATIFNGFTDYFFVGIWGGFGLALATSLSGLIQTILGLFFLCRVHAFAINFKDLGYFVVKYSIQVICGLLPFYLLYPYLYSFAESLPYSFFFTQSFGFWIWVAPLVFIFYGLLYFTRNLFKMNLYFLD
ncbi:murein biosynthesis integral membrane protein MurJ [Candidatus Babeliales bacterium]|nr:murein biosynthesis integral membrane protein MurJ [Candidatus Babeliales bacterium]